MFSANFKIINTAENEVKLMLWFDLQPKKD